MKIQTKFWNGNNTNIFNKYYNLVKNDLGNEITIKQDITQVTDSIININNKLSNENKDFIRIKNLGFTCYLNSVLQVLYHIEPFKNAILNVEFNINNENGLNQLKKLFINIKYNKNLKYIIPKEFINNFFLKKSM